jgi:anti-anti-sigma regulatory factor
MHRWWADDLSRALAERSVRHGAAIRRGQLTIAPVHSSLRDSRSASALEMISVLTHEIDRAAKDGYPCVRIAADMCWATRPLAAAEQLVAFENVAAQVYYDSPLLRICRQYSPSGVRVAGELDYRQQQELEHALGESLRLDRNMHLNLRDLSYIDVACASLIVRAARRLPGSRHIIITCRGVVRTVLDLVGANSAPRIRVTLAHGHA